jgi:phage/plasmid-like protein (TIGR03299 family)
MTFTLIVDRQDAFAALGTAIEPGTTVLDALTAAGMTGWNVRKEPLVARVDDVDVPVKDKFVVLRDHPDTGAPDAFGVVGNYWKPFANEQTAQLLTDLVDESHGHVSRVGELRGGRTTFVSIKLPQTMVFTSPITGELDVTELHLAIFNSHDGTGSVSGMITPIRLYCANQQRVAERTARSRFSFRHTGDMRVKLSEVRAKLSIAFAYQETVEAGFRAMIEREMNPVEVFEVIQAAVRVEGADTERAKAGRVKTAEDIMEVYRQSDTVANFRGTAFGAYNAVTEWADHYMAVGGPATGKAIKRATRTIESSGMDDFKSRAFELLVPA